MQKIRNITWEAMPGTIPLIWCGSRVQGISETTSLWCRTSRRGQHLLASSAASGRPWLPMCRDGDLIPCSMTIALLAYPPRIVAFLVLKWCPHSCLWSQCHGWVVWALYFFRNSTWEDKPGTTPCWVWPRCSRRQRNHFARASHVATGSAPQGAGFKPSVRTALASSA